MLGTSGADHGRAPTSGISLLPANGRDPADSPCDFVLDFFNGVLSIPSSKSGVRSNSRESVTIHDPSAIETTLAMTTMKQQMGAMNVPCWQRSGSSFRALLNKILTQLDISNLTWRPYSLRRGGATYEMQTHGLMEHALIRGRWNNSNVARLYICDGLAMLPRLCITWTAKFRPVFVDLRQRASLLCSWGAWKEAKNQ